MLSASDGEAALRGCETIQEGIHLLITDMVMPRVCGLELAVRIRVVRPRIKKLYESGSTSLAGEGEAAPKEDVFFLEKPFTLSDLSHKVRQVLDALPR